MEHRGNPDGTEVYVEKLPKCDFCDKPALYDGKTIMGPWAHMCEEHFKQYGVGLGTGRGQKLIPRKALAEAEKIRGEPEKELSVTMTEDDLETATFEDVWYPVCPYCGAATPAEPDAHAVYCQACNRRFKIINPFFSTGEWTRLGYTARQERQLQFLERMEPHERLGYPPTYWVDCRTCKVGREFHSVEGARSFIKNHKGHDTWLKYGGTVDALKLGSSSNPRRETMDELRAKQIAEEAAVKAVELQGSRIAEQVAKEMSGEMLHQSPISPHCEAVLETPPKCYDFRGIRSWVLCKAWDILEREKRIRLPVSEAWAEARGICVRD